MKVVLITSGQPSLNPRIVKEADALIEAGYEVTLIYQFRVAWAEPLDFEILNRPKLKSIRVGGHITESPKKYFFTRIRHKLAQWSNRLISLKFIALYIIGRCTPELIHQAKKIKADIYIAHNLAALPAAVIAAKKNKAKCGFDAEDLHRYEMSNDETDSHVKLKKIIEEKYFHKVDYLTTSSPQIVNQYNKLFPKLLFNNILNVFGKQVNSKPKTLNNDVIKMLWFSQNVGLLRGLQDVIIALKSLLEFEIEFHILGHLASHIREDFDKLILNLNFPYPPKIFFHEPIDAVSLQKFINQFDIGLATEPAFSINNDSALSNKIFTYIQSGLAVIASDTTAQKQLLEDYPNMGIVYKKNDPESLAYALKTYLEDKYLLLAHQKQAVKYADEILNWEVEKEKFLSIVKYTLEN